MKDNNILYKEIENKNDLNKMKSLFENIKSKETKFIEIGNEFNSIIKKNNFKSPFILKTRKKEYIYNNQVMIKFQKNKSFLFPRFFVSIKQKEYRFSTAFEFDKLKNIEIEKNVLMFYLDNGTKFKIIEIEDINLDKIEPIINQLFKLQKEYFKLYSKLNKYIKKYNKSSEYNKNIIKKYEKLYKDFYKNKELFNSYQLILDDINELNSILKYQHFIYNNKRKDIVTIKYSFKNYSDIIENMKAFNSKYKNKFYIKTDVENNQLNLQIIDLTYKTIKSFEINDTNYNEAINKEDLKEINTIIKKDVIIILKDISNFFLYNEN